MSDAYVYSQSYRPYEGPRTGLAGAFWSLVRHSVSQALGKGRLARHKILVVTIIIFAYLPAIVMIGMAALLPPGTENLLPSYPDYYGMVGAVLYLFTGLVTPEILCEDRRTGMLGVYFASPLQRLHYLAAKATATLILLALVTLGPPLLMLLAFTLQDIGPSSLSDWLLTLWKIVISSLLLGLAYSAVALAVSSFTDRRAVATAGVMVAMPGLTIFVSILVEEVGTSPLLRNLNIFRIPAELVSRLFDSSGAWSRLDNPSMTLLLAWTCWVLGCSAIVWIRYRKLQVTR